MPGQQIVFLKVMVGDIGMIISCCLGIWAMYKKRTKEAMDAIERRLSYKRRDTGDKAGQRLHLTKLSQGKLTDWSNLKSGITEVQDIHSSTHLWDILSTQGHERVTNESWPCILASHWNPVEEIDHTTKKLYPAQHLAEGFGRDCVN